MSLTSPMPDRNKRIQRDTSFLHGLIQSLCVAVMALTRRTVSEFIYSTATFNLCLKEVSGLRVAQLRVVFQVPEIAVSGLFTQSPPPTYLAYVEWFTPFPPEPEPNHLMYRISRSYKSRRRFASVVPITAIKRSVHLFPQFGPTIPRHWRATTVLEDCRTFYVNPFIDKEMYKALI